MLTDARLLDHGATLETDVCVIGAGPAGIALALELAGSGLDVVILESGGVQPRRQDQELADGENADRAYYRLRRSRVIGFGGSSNHWMHTSGMRARPLDELDLLERPEIGRIGWPITVDDLATPYRRAQEICRLGPYAYATDDIASPERPALGLDPAAVETVAFRIAALGNFPGRLSEVVSAPNVRLLVHATALHLDVDRAGTSVTRVPVAADDVRFDVRPRATVVAGGGLENPRMLLLSHVRQRTAFADVADQVGRYLMEHPHVRTGVLLPSPTLTPDALDLYQVHPGRTETFGMLALPAERAREERLLAAAWSLKLTPAAQTTTAARAMIALRETAFEFRRPVPGTAQRVGTILRDPRDVARAVGAKVRGDDGPQVLSLTAMTEQEPNPDSRVLLGGDHDRFGRPVARVDWRLTDLDLRTIRRSQELLGEAFADAGLGRLVEPFGSARPPELVGGGFHHIGTTRMGRGPDDSVVDADGKVHGLEDCYVAGMSVFPTAGFANPTLTVVALAVRLAGHLRRTLENGQG